MTDRRRAMMTIDPMAERLAVLEQQHAALAALVDRLVGAGARDHEDVRLIAAVHEFAASRVTSFTTAEIFRWRAVRPEIAAALERADIASPRQLGKLFGRVRGRDLAGLMVARGKRDGREGWRWTVRLIRV